MANLPLLFFPLRGTAPRKKNGGAVISYSRNPEPLRKRGFQARSLNLSKISNSDDWRYRRIPKKLHQNPSWCWN